MKEYILGALIVSSLYSTAYAGSSVGKPLRHIAGCEIDLNNDGRIDIALLLESSNGIDLIALIRTINGYTATIVTSNKQSMNLSCKYGKTVTETEAGKGNKIGKIFDTPGTYLQLSEPEGASAAYFWTGNGFKEVWISD